MTREELQALLQEKLIYVAKGIANASKRYTDAQINTTKEELKQAIVDELSGIEGLGEELEKIKAYADSFAKVFDIDENGEITPEEILAKFTALQSNIDAVAKDVATNAENIKSVEEALNKAIDDVIERVKALEIRVSRVEDDVAGVKAELSTNYFTKSDIETLVNVNYEAVIKEVEDIFGFNAEEGDGATL